MFAGHIGAAMALGRAERRVNIAAFMFAAMLLDFVLWAFVLLGWESVVIPADFATTHQPQFSFAWSHGLAGSAGWSLAAGAVAYACGARLGTARLRLAALVAAAVFSHWVLDAIVHAPELPLAGNDSAKVGLSLWHSMPVALGLEGVIAIGGLWLFLSGAALSRAKKVSLAVLALVILAFTVAGMTVAPPPPSVAAMALSSLVTIAAVCALGAWLGR